MDTNEKNASHAPRIFLFRLLKIIASAAPVAGSWLSYIRMLEQK
jgi:hypothetical protein